MDLRVIITVEQGLIYEEQDTLQKYQEEMNRAMRHYCYALGFDYKIDTFCYYPDERAESVGQHHYGTQILITRHLKNNSNYFYAVSYLRSLTEMLSLCFSFFAGAKFSIES